MKSLYETVQIRELDIAFAEAIMRGDKNTAKRISEVIMNQIMQGKLRKKGL